MLRIRSVSTGVAGTPWYTNIYMSGGSAAAADARARVVTFWNALVGIQRSDLQTVVEQEVWEIDPFTGDTLGISNAGTGAPATGTSASPPLPTANQGLIRVATQGVQRNRRVKGKIYVPGLTTGSMTDGRLNNATITVLTNAAQGLVGGTGPSRLVVWSRPLGPFGPIPAVLGSEHTATGIGVWNEYAVLRSRRD